MTRDDECRNLVLNDDTVICPECYDDRVNDGGQIFDIADNAIMGYSHNESCRWCGREPMLYDD